MKTVLLVEDRQEDVLLMKRVCDRLAAGILLRVAGDYESAINYLTKRGAYADPNANPPPDLILLDIRLPRGSGHEILAWLRKRPEFAFVPVVMFSSSSDASDINRAYSLGANSYLQKPINFDDFKQTVPLILKYWLELNQSPGADP